MATEVAERKKTSWLLAVLIGRNPKRTLLRIVVLVAACVVVFKFVLIPIRVHGPSMMPTYQESGVNFINRLAYLRSQPKRGDVVGVRLSDTPEPGVPSIMLMKRIVGLPGETVAFHEGRLLINGNPLDEPYETNECNWEIAPKQLGPDEYYVVGDNRTMPEELHVKGVAHRFQIVGKVLLWRNLFASLVH